MFLSASSVARKVQNGWDAVPVVRSGIASWKLPLPLLDIKLPGYILKRIDLRNFAD